MKRRGASLFYWALLFSYSAAIFFFSAQSDLPHLKTDFYDLDKLEHLAAYTVWGFLFSLALRSSWPGWRFWPGILAACLAGLFYGASDEIHQMFVPNRHASLADLATDGIGALLGAVLYGAWRYRKLRRGRDGAGPFRP